MRLVTATLALAMLGLAPVAAAKANDLPLATASRAAAAEAPGSEVGEAAKKERIICKREIRTGSNMRGREICLTARAWKNRQSEM